MMKILHIVPSYIPAYRYGGPIESVHNLNAGLVKAGADVTVYTTDIDGSKNLSVPSGVPVIVDGVKVFYFRSSFPRFWFYSRNLHRALAKNGRYFDIFHITSTFLSASTLGAYYAKKFKKPYIISPRGNLMSKPLGKKSAKKVIYNWFVEKRNLKDAAAIHFTSFVEKEEYIKGGFSLKKGIVLPNIVDEKKFEKAAVIGDFRKKFGISNEKKIVSYLGRLNWIKGFDTLIPAFKKVVEKEPNAFLVLAGGDDGFRDSILQLMEKFKLRNHVLLTGILLDDEKNGLLEESSLFIMPSYSESFGMSVAEAMSKGLPVVVTKGVGISDFVNKTGAGIVVNKTEDDVSGAVIRILGDVNLARRMGENGRNLVKKNFSRETIARQFLKEYELLMGKNN